MKTAQSPPSRSTVQQGHQERGIVMHCDTCSANAPKGSESKWEESDKACVGWKVRKRGSGEQKECSMYKNSKGKGSQMRKFTVFWKTQRSVWLELQLKGWKLKRWTWTGPDPASWRSLLALLWNLELPQWKQESLAKKWHDQTDTLKRSLWPPRAEWHSVQEVKTEVKDTAERLANGTKYLRKQKEMWARRNWGWGQEGKNSWG